MTLFTTAVRSVRAIPAALVAAAFLASGLPFGIPGALATTTYSTLLQDLSTVEGFALGPGNSDHVLIDNHPTQNFSTYETDQSGAWVTQTIPGHVDRGDLLVDGLGHAFVATDLELGNYSESPFALSTNASGTWVTTPLVTVYGGTGAGPAGYSRLAIAPNGDVLVAWSLRGSDYLFYRRWSAGVWGPIVDVAPSLMHSSTDYQMHFDVVADASSEPHFIVAGMFPLLPTSATCWNTCALELSPNGSGGWTQTELGTWSGGSVEALRTPTNDFLVTIGYSGPIPFLKKSAGAWTEEDIPGTSAVLPATIALTSNGPVVFFQNNNGADQWARRADRSPSGWVVTQLAFQGEPYGALDTTGTAHVAYSWWKSYPNNQGNQLASYLSAPDVAAPVVSGVIQRFKSAGITGTTVPLTISWSAHDVISGISRYELQRRIGTGAWTSLGSTFTSPAVAVSLTPSTSLYQFRVRAWDKAGHVSGFAYSLGFTVTRYQESSTAVHYGGTWTLSSSTNYSGGATRYATTNGRYVTFTFSGFAFAWVSATGPTRGSAHIYMDGILQPTLSLYSSTTVYRKIVYQYRGGRATHTFRVVVLATAGHPRVDLDAVLVIR